MGTGILKKAMGIEMSGAKLGNLAGRATHRRLMALATRLCVVNRAQTVRSDVLDFFEEFLIGGTPAGIRESVALVVEPRGRFLCL
jgi:hypothetical protein